MNPCLITLHSLIMILGSSFCWHLLNLASNDKFVKSDMWLLISSFLKSRSSLFFLVFLHGCLQCVYTVSVRDHDIPCGCGICVRYYGPHHIQPQVMCIMVFVMRFIENHFLTFLSLSLVEFQWMFKILLHLVLGLCLVCINLSTRSVF